MRGLKDAVTVFVAKQQQHLKVAGISVAAGLVLLVCVFWVYDLLTSPPVPDTAVASAEEIARFMGDRRGMSRMSRGEQVRFLAELWPRFDSLAGRMEFSDAFAQLAASEMRRVQDAFFELAKEQVKNDAEEFNRLSEEQRKEFVAKKVDEYDALRSRFRGEGSDAFKEGLPSNSDDWTKSMVSRTSAGDRAKAQPYLNAVQKYVESEKHHGRWAAKSSRGADDEG